MPKRKTKPKERKPDIFGLSVQEPPIEVQELDVQERSRFWPDSKPIPETFRRGSGVAYPCMNPEPGYCGDKPHRVWLDNGGRAVEVVVTGHAHDIDADCAVLRCKSCGYRWQLPLEVADQ